jgi:glycosyltransferase involved in cell wall biosynthesis
MINNIVIVSDFGYIEGGAAKIAINTAYELSRLCPDKRIVFFCGKGPFDLKLFQDNIDIVCTNQKELIDNRLTGFFQGIWNPLSRLRLQKLLNSLDKDKTIVHIHSWTKVLSSSVLSAVDRRLIVTLHDFFSICPNGAFYNYQTHNICTKSALSLDCIADNCDKSHYAEKLWRVIRGKVHQYFFKRINNFIVLSDLSYNIFNKSLLNKKFYKIKNPLIEYNSSINARVRVEDNKKFVFIGRLDSEKGVMLFVKALKATGFDAVFIGDGKLKTDIQKILPNSEITGWLDQKDVQKYLKDARCLVFPSVWYETFGLTVLEAGSLGIPSIVSAECSAAELIDDIDPNSLFSSSDEEELIEKMNFIHGMDSIQLKDLSIRYFEKFNSNEFSVKNYVNGLLLAYEEIINGGPPSSQ